MTARSLTLLLSAVLVAAGPFGAAVEAAPAPYVTTARCWHHPSGICMHGGHWEVVPASYRNYSSRRGFSDPNCRYKCKFCGPIKTCATVCR